MAFKMKAGKEGPMKKNFPSAFKQDEQGWKHYFEEKENEAKRDSIRLSKSGGVKFKDLSKEEKQKSLTKMNQLYNAKFAPKGKSGTDYRKREYDARGWAYDDTIKQ